MAGQVSRSFDGRDGRRAGRARRLPDADHPTVVRALAPLLAAACGGKLAGQRSDLPDDDAGIGYLVSCGAGHACHWHCACVVTPEVEQWSCVPDLDCDP